MLATLAGTSVLPAAFAQANPSWQGQPFVKIVAKGDPIPGTPGATFGVIENLTLRDGTIHFVAGENLNKKGLFRWRAGVLTKLVYTDTLAPNGKPFDTVDSATDETEGALNFGALAGAGQPGALAGLFEWRNGVITTIFDGQRAVDGKILHGGLGYPVRVGHQLAGSALFTENGVEKNGIFRWDGTNLHTVVQTGDDLPGSLGGFLGTPRGHQIAFDGQNVGFVAAAGVQGVGPVGMYRAGPDGVLTKLVDGNDVGPGGKTFFQRNRPFTNLDLDGTNSFLGVTGRVAATSKGNSFYYQYASNPGEIVRFSDGTNDIPRGSFGDNNTLEFVLLAFEADQVTPTQLDGQLWRVQTMDGHGDDVAALVLLRTPSAYDKPAIYAAISATAVTPTEVKLGAATLVPGGPLSFTLPTQAGVTYVLETKANLGDASWTLAQTITGDGSVKKLEAALAGLTGFFRVRVQ